MAAQQSSIDPQSIKAELYGIDVSFTLLAVLAVIFRFWARYRSSGNYGWDDWLVLVSLTLVFANFAMNTIMIENGLGLQAVDVPFENLVTIGKGIFADEIVYVVALAVIKIAILVMYCRVFPLRSFRLAAWIISTITVLWSLIFVFICIFQCNPIPRAWNLLIPGTCLNLRHVFISNAIPNIVTDACILCMPMYHVWRLQVRTAQRFALTGIFMLGAFVIVASIYRFTTILKLNPLNLSYTLKTPTTWSHVEVSVALISACLPTMRPLLMSFLNLIGMNSSTKDDKSGPSAKQESRKIPSRRKPPTGLTEFSMLDEGKDEWSTQTKQTSSSDEVPLSGIQIRKSFEHRVVETAGEEDWVDERQRKAWYPGGR